MNPMYQHIDIFKKAIEELSWRWSKLKEEPHSMIYYIHNTGTILIFSAVQVAVISFNCQFIFTDYYIEAAKSRGVADRLKQIIADSIFERLGGK